MKRTTKSLIDVQKELGTEEQCLALLEAIRWPEGVRCLKCDGDKISKFKTAEGTRKRKHPKTGEIEIKTVPARHLYQCLNPECGHQFSATTGTIFNDTHLPLNKWMLATAIICNAKKGVSALQLHRDIDVGYKTAWYLYHRIREAMGIGESTDEKLSGVVECDETYVGGKYDRRRRRERWEKDMVFGIVERKGDVRAWHMPEGKRDASLVGKIVDNVTTGAIVMSDEANIYRAVKKHGYKHQTVHHSIGQYVKGQVHTNTIENFWSLFKRGLIGQFHKISIKYLDRYLTEFCYRFNNRENEELFTLTVACLVLGIPLPYAKLIGRTEEPSERPS